MEAVGSREPLVPVCQLHGMALHLGPFTLSLSLLDPLKKVLKGGTFRSYGNAKAAVVQWFRQQPSGFFVKEVLCLPLDSQQL
jgi:hypothetical protein